MFVYSIDHITRN